MIYSVKGFVNLPQDKSSLVSRLWCLHKTTWHRDEARTRTIIFKIAIVGAKPHSPNYQDSIIRTLLVRAFICLLFGQERIMTSFLFGRDEEERVTSENSKQAESPACRRK